MDLELFSEIKNVSLVKKQQITLKKKGWELSQLRDKCYVHHAGTKRVKLEECQED